MDTGSFDVQRTAIPILFVENKDKYFSSMFQFSNAATLGDDDEYLSCLSANNDQLEFPPHLTVELAGVAIKYAKVIPSIKSSTLQNSRIHPQLRVLKLTFVRHLTRVLTLT